MDEAMLMQILSALGQSPNEGFGVQPGQDNRLGMSQESQVMGNVLSQLQGAGVQPPMRDQFESGNDMEMVLMQIIQALREQQLGMPQPMEQNPQNDGTLGGSNELLKALLSGS